MTKLLLTILGNALWNPDMKEKIPSSAFSSLMAIADKQAVVGFVLDGIGGFQEADAPKDDLFEYIGIQSDITQDNGLLNREVAQFARTCKEHKIEYIVVKGQLMAKLYPHPELRMPGDIDFLIKEKYTECKGDVEKAFGVALPKKLIEKEIAFNRGLFVYELHGKLIEFGKKKHQQYWDSLMAHVWDTPFYETINEEKVRTLSPTVNAVYLFLHIFTHFIRGGIGLRQFCDWAVCLKYYEKDVDHCKVQEILEELDLQYAYGAFGTILVDKLGLPVSSFPMNIADSHRKWTNMILDDIFRGGNLGRYNHNCKHPLLYKFESVGLVIRNTFRYYRLAPSEMCMVIPQMIKINLRLLFS